MISDRLTYGLQTPSQTSKRERKRGHDLAWTLRGDDPGGALRSTREGKPVDETRY